MNYDEFLERKSQLTPDRGFDPIWMPEMLFDFQKALVEWSCKKGRAAIFADCGLGKTLTVLTPFMGVGSEVYGSVLNGRRGIGIELKPSYYRQAVRNLASIKPDAENMELFSMEETTEKTETEN